MSLALALRFFNTCATWEAPLAESIQEMLGLIVLGWENIYLIKTHDVNEKCSG